MRSAERGELLGTPRGLQIIAFHRAASGHEVQVMGVIHHGIKKRVKTGGGCGLQIRLIHRNGLLIRLHRVVMCAGMWTMCPAAGASSASRFALASARSGELEASTE